MKYRTRRWTSAEPVSCSKQRPRPSEIDRPDVAAKRAAFVTWVRLQDPDRLVSVDEAGANLAMGRSHVWVQRGEEYVEARPMNWGDNLTLVGAIRRRGWVVLSTKWRAMNKVAFVEWVRHRLAVVTVAFPTTIVGPAHCRSADCPGDRRRWPL